MNELMLDRPAYKRGERGGKAKLIQEWLGLHGFKLQLDGDFGPATELAVKRFQEKKGLAATGVVDSKTFESLTSPMKAVLQKVSAGGRSVGQLTLAYARQHLAQHPVEIGGQNRGPWVRLYMNGQEGDEFAWCAGFATYCLKQACEALGVSMPIRASFSCDEIAASARQQGRFLPQPAPAERKRITPGSLFLVRKSPTDWTHTGIVASTDDDSFETVEGNTNDEGSREGYEVCARVRAFKDQDFVLI